MDVQCTFSVPAVGHCAWTALLSAVCQKGMHYTALYAHCTSSWGCMQIISDNLYFQSGILNEIVSSEIWKKISVVKLKYLHFTLILISFSAARFNLRNSPLDVITIAVLWKENHLRSIHKICHTILMTAKRPKRNISFNLKSQRIKMTFEKLKCVVKLWGPVITLSKFLLKLI